MPFLGEPSSIYLSVYLYGFVLKKIIRIYIFKYKKAIFALSVYWGGHRKSLTSAQFLKKLTELLETRLRRPDARREGIPC